MSANRSQRQVRAAILAGMVAEYAAWEVWTGCGPCNREATVAVASLPRQDVTMGEAIQRLRCAQCGGRPAYVAVDNRQAGWRGATVKLWGPGSYGWNLP